MLFLIQNKLKHNLSLSKGGVIVRPVEEKSPQRNSKLVLKLSTLIAKAKEQ